MFIVSRHSCATNMYVDVSMAACTMVKMLFDVNEGKSKSGRFFVVLRVTIKMNSYHLSYVETVLKNGGQTKNLISSPPPRPSPFDLRYPTPRCQKTTKPASDLLLSKFTHSYTAAGVVTLLFNIVFKHHGRPSFR